MPASRERIPIGRLGRPQEVAEAIVVLPSVAASFVGGADLRTGGAAAPRRRSDLQQRQFEKRRR